VVGLGAVGSFCVELLARTGVGQLDLIDADDLCVSNIGRNMFACENTLGKLKVEVAAKRCRLINPHIKLALYDRFCSFENIAEIISPNSSFLIDACDSVRAKMALISYAHQQNIPLSVCGATAMVSSPWNLTWLDLNETRYDPLLARTRKELKKLNPLFKNKREKWGISCLSSPIQRKKTFSGRISCTQAGSLGTVTSVAGIFLAHKAIEYVLR